MSCRHCSAPGPVPGRLQKEGSMHVNNNKSSHLRSSPTGPALHKHVTLTPPHTFHSPQQLLGGSATVLSLIDEETEAGVQKHTQEKGADPGKNSSCCSAEKSSLSPGGSQQGTAGRWPPLRSPLPPRGSEGPAASFPGWSLIYP